MGRESTNLSQRLTGLEARPLSPGSGVAQNNLQKMPSVLSQLSPTSNLLDSDHHDHPKTPHAHQAVDLLG